MYHETKTNIIYTFTVQLYNISTRWNTLENICTPGLAASVLQSIWKRVHVDQIRYVSTYRELTRTHEGFGRDWKLEFI
jgi:hypothetical protein